MTSTKGIYADPKDPATLVEEIAGKDVEEVIENMRFHQESCVGASRAGERGGRVSVGRHFW